MTVKLVCTKGISPAYPLRRSTENTRIPGFQFKVCYEVWKPVNHVSSPEKINLFFIHGAQLNKEIWRYHIELLYERLGDILGVCIAADNVDHGDSYLLNEKALTFHMSIADAAKDMCCVLSHVNEPGRNIVIGHSFGGTVAHYMALIEPALVDSIVVFDPIMHEEPELFDSPLYKDTFRKIIAKLYQNIQTEFKTKKEYDDFVEKKHIARTFDSRVRNNFADNSYKPRTGSDPYISKVPAASQLSGYVNTLESLRYGKHVASSIPHEVLHIVGSIYDWQTPKNIESYRKCVRNITSIIIEDAGHNAPYQKPVESCDLIADFVRKRALYKDPKPLSPADGYKQFMDKLKRHENMVYSKL